MIFQATIAGKGFRSEILDLYCTVNAQTYTSVTDYCSVYFVCLFFTSMLLLNIFSGLLSGAALCRCFSWQKPSVPVANSRIFEIFLVMCLFSGCHRISSFSFLPFHYLLSSLIASTDVLIGLPFCLPPGC